MKFSVLKIMACEDECLRVIEDVDVIQTGPFGGTLTAYKDGVAVAVFRVWDDYPIRINATDIHIEGSLEPPDSIGQESEYGTWVLSNQPG
jgi:hypothetical protein